MTVARRQDAGSENTSTNDRVWIVRVVAAIEVKRLTGRDDRDNTWDPNIEAGIALYFAGDAELAVDINIRAAEQDFIGVVIEDTQHARCIQRPLGVGIGEVDRQRAGSDDAVDVDPVAGARHFEDAEALERRGVDDEWPVDGDDVARGVGILAIEVDRASDHVDVVASRKLRRTIGHKRSSASEFSIVGPLTDMKVAVSHQALVLRRSAMFISASDLNVTIGVDARDPGAANVYQRQIPAPGVVANLTTALRSKRPVQPRVIVEIYLPPFPGSTNSGPPNYIYRSAVDVDGSLKQLASGPVVVHLPRRRLVSPLDLSPELPVVETEGAALIVELDCTKLVTGSAPSPPVGINVPAP